MIDKQRVMDETGQGLDILLDLYPQARNCVEGSQKMFKMRPSERTPSATIRRNKAGEWVVCDFGGDSQSRNAIDEWMRVNGYDRSRFGAAVQAIAQQYRIYDTLSPDKNFSRVVDRAAREDEEEGSWQYELRPFTKRELAVLGPGVTEETCKELNWYACDWIGKVKNRRVKEMHSSDDYPILIRECLGGEGSERLGGSSEEGDDGHSGESGESGMSGKSGISGKDGKDGKSACNRFFKVYRPLEPDKRWRFMYFPDGNKPAKYINGLYELRKAHEKLNKKLRESKSLDDGDDVPQTKKVCDIRKTLMHGVDRYYRVVLCSGERDALCVRARGDFPIWLNSETARLDWVDYNRIIQLAGELVNIPDLDSTGVAAGSRLALKFMEMQTVWLPDSLPDLKDNRGRPCKDFRDWCQHHPSIDEYYDLMDTACPAKFWTTRVTKDGERKSRIDPICLHQFLRLHGFHILKDDTCDEPQYVRLKDGVVHRKTPRDIREFVRKWASGEKDPDATNETLRMGTETRLYLGRDVRNLILTDVSFTPAYLSALSTVDPDFTSHTATTQDFFFLNGMVHCHPDGYELVAHRNGGGDTCVWSSHVIQHRFRKTAPMFKVKEDPARQWSDGTPRFTIEIDQAEAAKSHYFGFLINSSRLYWRTEIEDAFPNAQDMQREYLRLHPFDIAGDHLTDRQRDEQARCLISKIFTIGYLMHAYKSPSRAWAPYAMDWRIADGAEANGRSGKSFFFKFLDAVGVERVALSGRNDHLMDNNFLYQNVTQYTRVVEVDDLSQRVQAASFYDIITGDMTIDKKHLSAFILPFEKSPKFAFTTNYVPGDFDPSSDARLLYLTFSDYYHQRTADNPFGYQETRMIRDDFDKDLFGTFYTEEEWNADFNFLMQCEAFYLSLCQRPIKIQPPMENILQRKLKADMGETFEDWATAYFAEDGGNVNRQLVRETVYQDFIKDTHLNAIKMKGFTLRLKAFADYCPWIHTLNPIEYRNAQGRNFQKTTDPLTGETKQVEMIHMRTVREEERIQASYDEIWNEE